jgi:hypothetical protein
MIKRIAKERRDTRRALIKLNRQDSRKIAMACWKILVRRKSIRAISLYRAHSLRKSVLDRELEDDIERMRVEIENHFNESERKEQKTIVFIEKSFKAYPLEWNRFRNSNWKVLSAMSVKDLGVLKYLFEYLFLMSKIYFEIVDGYSAPIFLENDDFYKKIVQRMYLERFRGALVVNFDDFSLCCRYPVARKKRQVQFFINLHSVEKIVGFYYFIDTEFLTTIASYFPCQKPVVEPPDVIQLSRILRIDFKTRYINRFIVTFFLKNDVCRVVLKCRMVRKKDGKVSDEGKEHLCSLLEAIEKLKSGFFDRFLQNVLELEDKMKIEHGFGRLLEHWDGCF